MLPYVDCTGGLLIDWSDARAYVKSDYTRAHMHPNYELLFVMDPLPYTAVIDGKILKGKGPVIMVIAPYCMHFTYYTDATICDKRYIAFYVDDLFFQRFSEDIVPVHAVIGHSNAKIFDVNPENEAKFRKILNLITDQFDRVQVPLSESRRRTNLKQQLLFGVLVDMLRDMEKNGGRTQNVSEMRNYITDVIVYIVSNLNKPMKTPEIASMFFVSRDKLNRDFRKYAQMSVRQFIIESKLNYAKFKIEEGKLSVAEIAELCGFESIAYFYAFFKQNTGMTPRKYSQKKLEMEKRTK